MRRPGWDDERIAGRAPITLCAWCQCQLIDGERVGGRVTNLAPDDASWTICLECRAAYFEGRDKSP